MLKNTLAWKKVITITTIINLVDSGPNREVLREGDRNGRPCCCWLHGIQPCCGKSWNLSLTLFHRAAIFKLTILNANARILLQRESNIKISYSETFLWEMGAKRQISLCSYQMGKYPWYIKISAGALPKLPKPRRFHLAWSETGKPRRSSHFFLPVQPEVGAWILDIHDQIQYTLSIDIIKLCVVDHKAAFFWTSLLNWSNLLDGLFKTIASYFTNWSPHSIQA